MVHFDEHLDNISPELENCYLNKGSEEVAAVIAGYVAKKVIKRNRCPQCKSLLIVTSESDCHFEKFEYLLKLSRGGLLLPSTDLSKYVCKASAMLDVAQNLIRTTELIERTAAEYILKSNDLPLSFLCENHAKNVKFVNRTICNVFYSNAQKLIRSQIPKDVVQHFKQRQRKRRFDETN